MEIKDIAKHHVVLALDRRDLRILSSALNYLASGYRSSKVPVEKLTGVNSIALNQVLDDKFLKLASTTQSIELTFNGYELDILVSSLRSFHDGRIVSERALSTYVGGSKAEIRDVIVYLESARTQIGSTSGE